MALKKNQIHLLTKELLSIFPGYTIYDKESIVRYSECTIQGLYLQRSEWIDSFFIYSFIDVLSVPKNFMGLQGFRLETLKHVNKYYDWTDNLRQLIIEIEKDVRSQSPELFAPFDDKMAFKFLTRRSQIRTGWGYELSRGHLLIKQGQFLRGRLALWQGLSYLNSYRKADPEMVQRIRDDTKELLSLPRDQKIKKLLDNVERTKRELKMIDDRVEKKTAQKALKKKYLAETVNSEKANPEEP